MRTLLGALLFLLPVLGLAACHPEEEGQQAASVESDPGPAEQLRPADSLLPPAPTEAQAPDSTGPLTEQEDAPQTAPGDTAQPAIFDLAERVRRLEEERDSLRITLRALSQLPSDRGLEPLETVAAQADPDELLQVDGERVRNWGLRTLVAVLVLLLTGFIVRFLAWILEKLAERNAKTRLMFKRMIPIQRIVIWAAAAFFVVRFVFSVGGQELLAASAALGVAVGFAAQDILKNVFGGLIVLFDQPFQVGDKISVGGTYGEVVAIGLRSTRIVTPDDNLVTVPNAQVVDGQVANANAGELNCQVVTDLFLPGWVDEREAKRIAFEAATSSKYIYLNKPIAVLVRDKFEDTFLTHLKVKAYVMDPRYEFLFMSDVTERARAGFREAGLIGPTHGARVYVEMDGRPAAPAEGTDEAREAVEKEVSE